MRADSTKAADKGTKETQSGGQKPGTQPPPATESTERTTWELFCHKLLIHTNNMAENSNYRFIDIVSTSRTHRTSVFIEGTSRRGDCVS